MLQNIASSIYVSYLVSHVNILSSIVIHHSLMGAVYELVLVEKQMLILSGCTGYLSIQCDHKFDRYAPLHYQYIRYGFGVFWPLLLMIRLSFEEHCIYTGRDKDIVCCQNDI